jgi:CheY-like chemotaxis protein
MPDPILYVEDTPDDVFLMQRAFRQIAPDVDVRVITNGQEAADVLGASPEKAAEAPPLSLIILDLNLPGRSGLEVLQTIRSKGRFPKVPVILFSASNRQEDIDSCYLAGANAYLVKPSASEELRTLVKLIHDFWLKANHYSKVCGG